MSLLLTVKGWFAPELDNNALMQRYARTGDPQDLAALYERCSESLYHFVLAMTDHALAQDVSQRTWLTVIEKRAYYRRQGRFESWLFTLARNRLIDELRQQQRFEHSSEGIEQLPSTPFADHDSPQQHLQQALAQLSFVQREAFCLQQEGFGLQEIGTLTHANVETVKSRLRHARSHLKRLLELDHEQ